MVYDLVALTIFNHKTYIAEQSYINKFFLCGGSLKSSDTSEQELQLTIGVRLLIRTLLLIGKETGKNTN